MAFIKAMYNGNDVLLTSFVHLERGEPMVTREEVFDVLMEIQKHLIKCKDCKWCEKSDGILWCNIWHDDTNGLNFCSYAERRSE